MRINPIIAKPPSRKQNPKPTVLRGSGFTQTETDTLLEILDVMLPLCREEWDAVLAKHNTVFGDQHRTVDSLKRKFSTLHRKRMPTGDPLMPDDVRKAKHIRHKMTERADVGFGDEDTYELSGIAADEDPTEAPQLGTSPALMSHVAPSTDPTATHNVSGVQVLPPTPPESSPSPRPLVNKRRSNNWHNMESNDFLTMMKMSMVQEQQRREDDARRRET